MIDLICPRCGSQDVERPWKALRCRECGQCWQESDRVTEKSAPEVYIVFTGGMDDRIAVLGDLYHGSNNVRSAVFSNMSAADSFLAELRKASREFPSALSGHGRWFPFEDAYKVVLEVIK